MLVCSVCVKRRSEASAEGGRTTFSQRDGLISALDSKPEISSFFCTPDKLSKIFQRSRCAPNDPVFSRATSLTNFYAGLDVGKGLGCIAVTYCVHLTFGGTVCGQIVETVMNPTSLLRTSAHSGLRQLPKRSFAVPAATRDSRFKSISALDLNHFKSIVGENGVITNDEDLMPLNADWMGRYKGQSKIALKPKTTEHVSAIMQYCNEQQIAVVPQGGNTGLVGGSVPVFDEVILCLSGMNEIEALDEASGVVVTQAGVVLETLENFVNEAGYRVPLDLGAKGSCQIGGNVATNAGGSRFIRYGSLRGSVLGLEAVLPDGRIMDTLTTLRKDNTGYDLKQLMIGGEGTLGVITRLAIACPIKSSSVDTAVLKVDDFQKVTRLLHMAKVGLGEILSAYEFMDHQSVDLALKHLAHVSNPIGEDGEEETGSGSGFVLIECAGSDADYNRAKLESFLEKAFEDGVVSNGVIAESETQSTVMWELRESLPEAVLKAGPGGTLKYDLSLPLDSFYDAVEVAREKVKDMLGVSIVGWGHIGDGNLHLNVSVENAADKEVVQGRLEPWVYEYVAACRGSVSAEHGLGLMKMGAIVYSKSEVAIDVMRSIKNAIDENGICNPYKVLPPATP